MLVKTITPAAATERVTHRNSTDTKIIAQNPWEVNTESQPFSYSLVDDFTRLQGMTEEELTGCLCIAPAETLRIAGEWLPEVGIKERAFWRFVKAIPDLQTISDSDQVAAVRRMAERQGMALDHTAWVCSVADGGSAEQAIRQKLLDVTVLRNCRLGLDYVSKHPELIERVRNDR